MTYFFGIYALGFIFASYVVFIRLAFGPLYSISQSYYELKKHGFGIVFYLFCFLLGVGVWFAFYKTENAFFLLSTAGLIFTGTAMGFKDNVMTERVHYVGAGLGIIGALLGIGFAYGNWWILLSVIPILIVSYFTKMKIWWFEVLIFLSIYIGLIIS